MLSILIPYRDRNIKHVENCLNSLADQTDQDFQVCFIDYGSAFKIGSKVKDLCTKYKFIKYKNHPVQDQPWNKSRALNSAIKNLETEFCFVADVDMIFHPDFVSTANKLQREEKTYYFQVGFLEQQDDFENFKFENIPNLRKSTREATGLSMFPVEVLKALHGFDEFYHFWGAEDTDMHLRLGNAGYPVEFYDTEVLMIHQWHPTYRLRESSQLTSDLQIKGIVQLNHEYLKTAKDQKRTLVNGSSWGRIPGPEEIEELKAFEFNRILSAKKSEVDSFMFAELGIYREGIIKVKISEPKQEVDWKNRARKILKGKIEPHYSLKEVNDKILLHIISFYRDKPYYYKVKEELDQIEFAIKFS